MFTLIVLDDIEWNTEKQNANLPETIYIRIPHAIDPRCVDGNALIDKMADIYAHPIKNLRVQMKQEYTLSIENTMYILTGDGNLARIYEHAK